MDEREAAEELLADVRETIRTVRRLMESENEDVQVFAVDAFVALAEMEMKLLEALGAESNSEERNPLARRARLDG